MLYLPVQMVLSLCQSFHHAIGLLQRFQDHAVLNALLQDALDAAVGIANFACKHAHLLDVHLAEQ